MQYVTSFLTIFPALLICTFLSQCQKADMAPIQNHEFRQILTENTLDDWEGDSVYWRFEEGILIGEITPENILIEHSFFTWKNDIVNDFELKAEYRISPRGNSGINYRSEKVAGKEFVLKGYQADIDGENQYSGQLYEEKGRAFLARRGQFSYIDKTGKVNEAGTVGQESELLSALIDDWNEYHLIVQGNTHVLMINGRVMSITIDNGFKQKKEGLLGFQLHLGPPMQVEFRNIRIKNIAS